MEFFVQNAHCVEDLKLSLTVLGCVAAIDTVVGCTLVIPTGGPDDAESMGCLSQPLPPSPPILNRVSLSAISRAFAASNEALSSLMLNGIRCSANAVLNSHPWRRAKNLLVTASSMKTEVL